MLPNDIDTRALRQKVEVEVRKQKNLTHWILFFTSLGMYILFMLLAWGMFISAGGAAPNTNIALPGTTSDNNPFTAAMVMLTVGWGTTVLFQFISAVMETKVGGRRMREQAIGRVIAQSMLGTMEDDLEPEKRKTTMRLTDDGEIEPVDENDAVEIDTLLRDEAARRQQGFRG
jgi:hypothetical protein